MNRGFYDSALWRMASPGCTWSLSCAASTLYVFGTLDYAPNAGWQHLNFTCRTVACLATRMPIRLLGEAVLRRQAVDPELARAARALVTTASLDARG